MQTEDFKKLVERRLSLCKHTLLLKATEYAPAADRLANFKRAAALQECAPVEALAGMMAKHTVAIYDFILTGAKPEQWEEKLTDSINYLLLLEALLVEKGVLKGVENAV